MNALGTLTDYEIAGLTNGYCLADGHAYQDLHSDFQEIVKSLPEIWLHASKRSIPEAEQLFNNAYAALIKMPILNQLTNNFRICPTASNSIDLVGALLNELKYKTAMIEPTFDNLALLIRRRGVALDSISDINFFYAAEEDEIDKLFPELKTYNALVVIHPNNPTGLILSENAYRNIVMFCKKYNITLVIDNCFRAYNRNGFSDYNILIESSVSFIAFEDTGKVWPTQDLKASLIYFSDDLKKLFCELYNEVYLCVSNLTLGILSAFFLQTSKVGIKKTIWDVVDKRRQLLRKSIAGSILSVSDVSLNSNLPVEWLRYSGSEKNDFIICQDLKKLNLAVLPGRQFYWDSPNKADHQKNIRISFMKPEIRFIEGIAILEKYCKSLSIHSFKSNKFEYSEAV